MSRTRWSDIAAITISIAVLAGLGFLLYPRETAIAATPSTVNVDLPAQLGTHRPTVLFIGDSYTGGHGVPEMSYGCMAATRMGWLCKLSAIPGTGYISGGPANRSIVDPYIGLSTSFAERIPKLAVQYDPDIVVLDGGRNDLFPPRGDVFNAMSATIAEVRRAWPSARIIFIRPRLLANPRGDLGFDQNFIARLQAEPAANGMVVLDPISQFTDTNTSAMLSEDGIHPNRPGELNLSSALVESLVSNGFAVTP